MDICCQQLIRFHRLSSMSARLDFREIFSLHESFNLALFQHTRLLFFPVCCQVPKRIHFSESKALLPLLNNFDRQLHISDPSRKTSSMNVSVSQQKLRRHPERLQSSKLTFFNLALIYDGMKMQAGGAVTAGVCEDC